MKFWFILLAFQKKHRGRRRSTPGIFIAFFTSPRRFGFLSTTRFSERTRSPTWAFTFTHCPRNRKMCIKNGWNIVILFWITRPGVCYSKRNALYTFLNMLTHCDGVARVLSNIVYLENDMGTTTMTRRDQFRQFPFSWPSNVTWPQK